MSSPSSEISSFQPRRSLFGYERKATDDFLEHVAVLLEEAGKRLDEAESELSRSREKEHSLHEALLAVAKTSEAIKHDARREAESIRGDALELQQFVASTRSKLSAFLHETLEKLDGIADEIDRREVAHTEQEGEPLEAAHRAEELVPTPETEAKEDELKPLEEAGSIFERLRPYRVDTSGSPRSPGS